MRSKILIVIPILIVALCVAMYFQAHKVQPMNPSVLSASDIERYKSETRNLTAEQAAVLAAKAKSIGDDYQQNAREFGSANEAEKALSKDPNDLVAIRTMATEDGAKGDFEGALKWENKGLALKANDQGLRFKKANTLLHLQHDEDGITILKALASEPGDTPSGARARLGGLSKRDRYKPYFANIDPKLLQP